MLPYNHEETMGIDVEFMKPLQYPIENNSMLWTHERKDPEEEEENDTQSMSKAGDLVLQKRLPITREGGPKRQSFQECSRYRHGKNLLPGRGDRQCQGPYP
jgi:hypothetical protein